MIEKEIRARLSYLGMNLGELADRIGVTRTTMYHYLKTPGKMPLGAAWKIESVLKWEHGMIGRL